MKTLPQQYKRKNNLSHSKLSKVFFLSGNSFLKKIRTEKKLTFRDEINCDVEGDDPSFLMQKLFFSTRYTDSYSAIDVMYL